MTDKSIVQLKTKLNPQWITLHNNYENYEIYALIIKLVAIILTSLVMALSINLMFILFIIATLWLQEGIWKTYQSRLSDAIMQIEQDNEAVYPLYSQWQENRPKTLNIINEYICNALKPTVAFPYALLMVLALFFHQSS